MVPRSVTDLHRLKSQLRALKIGSLVPVAETINSAIDTMELLSWAETHNVELRRHSFTTVNSVASNIRTNNQEGWVATAPAFPGTNCMGETMLAALSALHAVWMEALILKGGDKCVKARPTTVS